MSSPAVRALFCLALLAGCASEGAGGIDPGPPRPSRFVTDPPGASVFVDGTFAGVTPTEQLLPAKPRVQVRIELPAHVPVDAPVDRRVGVAADAPAGTGWEELYFWTLMPR